MIIKRWIQQSDQDKLFLHTKALTEIRQHRASKEPRRMAEGRHALAMEKASRLPDTEPSRISLHRSSQSKSILRPPRGHFPQGPAPVREGVAPLKDASKKGIPSNARWPKSDRKVVNLEALLAANERYEERVDHVIVLRVMTREEIEQYTAPPGAEGVSDESPPRSQNPEISV